MRRGKKNRYVLSGLQFDVPLLLYVHIFLLSKEGLPKPKYPLTGHTIVQPKVNGIQDATTTAD